VGCLGDELSVVSVEAWLVEVEFGSLGMVMVCSVMFERFDDWPLSEQEEDIVIVVPSANWYGYCVVWAGGVVS